MSTKATVPRVSAASSTSLPAAVTAAAPFVRAETRISVAKAAETREQGGRRYVSLSSKPADGQHGDDEEAEVGRANRGFGARNSDLDAGQVACPEQAEDNGDEEDGEGEIPRRPPHRSWQLAGHEDGL